MCHINGVTLYLLCSLLFRNYLFRTSTHINCNVLFTESALRPRELDEIWVYSTFCYLEQEMVSISNWEDRELKEMITGLVSRPWVFWSWVQWFSPHLTPDLYISVSGTRQICAEEKVMAPGALKHQKRHFSWRGQKRFQMALFYRYCYLPMFT